MPRNADGIVVDELLTGGLLSNFAQLLDGVFEKQPTDGTVVSYADLAAFEGTVLSVEAESVVGATEVEASLRRSGAMKIARSTP